MNMQKITQIRVYLLTLSVIFLTSASSTGLLLFYLDPESNMAIWIWVMSLAVFLTLSSLLTLFIYFFKKIYYRWEIYISNLNSSLRQGILITIMSMWAVTFYAIWVGNFKTVWLLFFVLFFIELIFQSFSD